MDSIEKGFVIGADCVKEFVRLLRARSEAWEEPWLTLFPSQAVRCEISYPRFRLKRRVIKGGGNVNLSGQIYENGEIRWSTDKPPQSTKFLIPGLALIWTVNFGAFLFGHDGSGAPHNVVVLLPGALLTAIVTVVVLGNRNQFDEQIIVLENHLKSIAAEAMSSRNSTNAGG